MISIFDIYSVGLLILCLVTFVVRYIRRDPPVLPYLVIACVCAVGNWLGEMGGGWAALALLVAASFLYLSCLLHPDKASRGKAMETPASKTPASHVS
jgi:hypothetical protein